MGLKLRILLIAFSVAWFFIIYYLLRKNKIPVKYSLIWFLAAFVLFAVGLIPGVLSIISNLFGFQTISNMIIGIILFLLLFITIVLTIIISDQKKKITLLIQEVSRIKREVGINNEK